MRNGGKLTCAPDAPARASRVALRALRLTSMALLVGCVASTPAWAKSEGPVYVLKVIEGETTLPEFPILQTSGEVREVKGKVSVAVTISRGGVVIYRALNENGSGTSTQQVPEVGDVVTLESPIGTPVDSITYDGMPTMAPTVCAESTNFSGENTLGYTVKGSYFTEKLVVEKYGTRSESTEPSGRAQVTALSGTSFGGSFLAPLKAGETVTATESLETPLTGNSVFTYVSENERPVGACPPVVVPPPPPPPPALGGSLLKLPHLTILSLLKSGLRDLVSIDQPGTVTQDLYLENGTLPASAASTKKHHHKPPPALLLARGAVVASSAGTVTVSLKLTAKGRAKLKSSKDLKAVLITTLRTSSGAKLTLARHALALRR
jgi:hypothetical protein